MTDQINIEGGNENFAVKKSGVLLAPMNFGDIYLVVIPKYLALGKDMEVVTNWWHLVTKNRQ